MAPGWILLVILYYGYPGRLRYCGCSTPACLCVSTAQQALWRRGCVRSQVGLGPCRSWASVHRTVRSVLRANRPRGAAVVHRTRCCAWAIFERLRAVFQLWRLGPGRQMWYLRQEKLERWWWQSLVQSLPLLLLEGRVHELGGIDDSSRLLAEFWF